MQLNRDNVFKFDPNKDPDRKDVTTLQDYPQGYKTKMEQARETAVDAIRIFADHHQIPGVACAVAVNNHIPVRISYGHSNKERLLEVHHHTKMRLGDLSMPITALIAYHLEHLGFLSTDRGIGGMLGGKYNDPLSLPHFDTLTLQHLLRHKIEEGEDFGFEKDDGDFTDLRDYYSENNFAEYNASTEKYNLPGVKDIKGADSDINKFFRKGYLLAACVMAEMKGAYSYQGNAVYNQVFDDFFCQAQLADTSVDFSESIKKYRSRQYRKKGDVIKVAPHFDPSLLLGASSFISTAFDVACIGQMILHPKTSNKPLDIPAQQVVDKMKEEYPIAPAPAGCPNLTVTTALGVKTSETEKVPGCHDRVIYNDYFSYSNSFGSRNALYLREDMKSDKQINVSTAILTNLEIKKADTQEVDAVRNDMKELAKLITDVFMNKYKELQADTPGTSGTSQPPAVPMQVGTG